MEKVVEVNGEKIFAFESYEKAIEYLSKNIGSGDSDSEETN